MRDDSGLLILMVMSIVISGLVMGFLSDHELEKSPKVYFERHMMPPRYSHWESDFDQIQKCRIDDRETEIRIKIFIYQEEDSMDAHYIYEVRNEENRLWLALHVIERLEGMSVNSFEREYGEWFFTKSFEGYDFLDTFLEVYDDFFANDYGLVIVN